MARRKVQAGSTSQTFPLFIQDTSSSVGAGLGSLLFNTSGLVAKYRREGQSAWTTITLATATVGTYATGGFVTDGGGIAGGYEFSPPDASLAAGAKWVEFQLYGATNMLGVLMEIELDTINYQSTGGTVPIDQTTAVSTTPVAGSIGEVLFALLVFRLTRRGTAQAGDATSITLDAGASGTDNTYRGYAIKLTGGTGSGQFGSILSYNGTSKVAVVGRLGSNSGWTIPPDNTTVFIIEPTPAANMASILGTALAETSAGYLTAAFKKLFDVAVPVFTAGSVNQGGDGYGVLTNGTYGLNALLTAIQNIQNGTFVSTTIPAILERPDSGSTTIQIVVSFSDETGTAKNLDSGNPTTTLVNDASTDLSSRLGAWSNPATGKYAINYTNTSTDTVEGLHWDVTGTIGGHLRRYVAYTQLVDTTAIDFTSADRTNLGTILTQANKLLFDGSSYVKSTPQTAVTLASITHTGARIPNVTLVDTLTTYTSNTPQSGDAFSRVGLAGVGLTNLGDTRIAYLDAAVTSRTKPADTQAAVAVVTTLTNDPGGVTTLLSRLTAARGGYLDNLNVGGPVASHADVVAINTSSSKHLIITTVGHYERPESGSTVYQIEVRTFAAADGSVVNADTTPTLTATGTTSGSLAANLAAATNPSTGVYRWNYTVLSSATNEPVRFDVSATIASSTFTLAVYTQVLDEISVTWTSTNAANLTAIFNKLPIHNIADENDVLAIGVAPTVSQITADIDAHSSQLSGIKTQTDKLQFDGSGYVLSDPRTAVRVGIISDGVIRMAAFDNSSRLCLPNNHATGNCADWVGAALFVASDSAGGPISYHDFNSGRELWYNAGSGHWTISDSAGGSIQTSNAYWLSAIAGAIGITATYNPQGIAVSPAFVTHYGALQDTQYVLPPTPSAVATAVDALVEPAATANKNTILSTLAAIAASQATHSPTVDSAGRVILQPIVHTGATIPNAPTAGDFTAAMKHSLNTASPAVPTVQQIRAEMETDSGELHAILLTLGAGHSLTRVNQDYGGTDALQYVSPSGNPVAGGKILIFSQDAYQRKTEESPPDQWAIGNTTTLTDGRWASPVMLADGLYVVQMSLAGVYGPIVAHIIVGTPGTPIPEPPNDNGWNV